MATLRTGRQCWQENFLCLNFKSTQNTNLQHIAEKLYRNQTAKNSQFFQPFLAQQDISRFIS
jgi:hypothetical protein